MSVRSGGEAVFTPRHAVVYLLCYYFISRDENKKCNKGRGKNKQESDSLIHLQLEFTLNSANSEILLLHTHVDINIEVIRALKRKPDNRKSFVTFVKSYNEF